MVEQMGRAGLVVIGLAASLSAWAWSPGETTTFDLPAVARRVVADDLNGGLAILAVNADATWVLHPRTGKVLAKTDRGGSDVTVTDLDGDKWMDIIVCADDGLWRVPLVQTGLGAPIQLSPQKCSRVARIDMGDGKFGLVTVSDVVDVWPIDAAGKLGAPARYGGKITGEPTLVATGARFGAIGAGDQTVLERSEFGESSFATGGAIGGLALGPRGWSWTLPEQNVLTDVTRRRIQVAPGASGVYGGDLDGDGERDLLVQHDEIGYLGVVLASESTERLVQIEGTPGALYVVDVNADTCGDLLYPQKSSPQVTLVRGVCEGGAPPEVVGVVEPVGPPTPPVADAITTSIDVTSEWTRVDLYVGQSLDLTLKDPQASATSFAGRGGPRGLVVRPDGHVTYTAQPDHVGRWRVSVRMWGGPAFVRRGGFELAVRPAPQGSGLAVPVAPDPTSPPTSVGISRPRPPAAATRTTFSVQGCVLGFGGAGGATDTSRSWEFIGDPVLISGSPALSFSCDGGNDKKFWWFAGVDTAPLFVYRVQQAEMRHGAAATIGLGVGGGKVHVGGFATAGLVILGLGGRVLWLPFEFKNESRHGFDLRATWFPTDAFAMQGMLLYSFEFGR